MYIKEDDRKEEMPIEEYIAGVVAGEMKPNWPLEAYAAQAILARSFTMEFISRGGTRALHGTDISTDHEEAQAYNADNITPIIRRAVEMTRGEVMTLQRPIYSGLVSFLQWRPYCYSQGRSKFPGR